MSPACQTPLSLLTNLEAFGSLGFAFLLAWPPPRLGHCLLPPRALAGNFARSPLGVIAFQTSFPLLITPNPVSIISSPPRGQVPFPVAHLFKLSYIGSLWIVSAQSPFTWILAECGRRWFYNELGRGEWGVGERQHHICKGVLERTFWSQREQASSLHSLFLAW